MLRKGSLRSGRGEKEYVIEYCKKRGELKEGDDFGDLALLNDKPRAATIRAEDVCYLAVLSRKQYDEILKKQSKKKKDQDIDQLGIFLLFKGFSRVYKSKCLESMKMLNLVRGNSIFKENDVVYKQVDDYHRKFAHQRKNASEFGISPKRNRMCMYKESQENEKILVPQDSLYFVLEGEFEICKTIALIKEENRTYIDFKGLKISEEMQADLGEDYEKIKFCESHKHYQNFHPQDSLTSRKMRSTKRVQMCIVGPGEIIGADEYIFKNTNRFSEVTCLSKKAKVLYMKIEEVNMLRKNEENIRKLK